MALGRGWEEAHINQAKENESAFHSPGGGPATGALRKPANQTKGVPHPDSTLSKQWLFPRWEGVGVGRQGSAPDLPGGELELGRLLPLLVLGNALLEGFRSTVRQGQLG